MRVDEGSGLPLAVKLASATYEVAMRLSNRFSRKRATTAGGPVVSLTSYGERLEKVFLTLESIANGVQRPSRLILWISDEGVLDNLPSTLKRLQSRGVELKATPDLGPHKKYYPLVHSENDLSDVLVTADDDVYYHRRWLSTLIVAHERFPADVIALRAREIKIQKNGLFAPYDEWALAPAGAASMRVFPTGVGGVLYPPAVVAEIRSAGDAFTQVAPRADDVWLHMLTIRSGNMARCVASPSTHELVPVRGSGTQGLWEENVTSSGNDVQIQATYPMELVAKIAGAE